MPTAPDSRASRNVVDSSAWLAYLADEPTAGDFAPATESTARLVVPADSIVYATARAAGAVVWTQDDDFDGLPGVRCVPRRPAR